jgi:hypothetical protein
MIVLTGRGDVEWMMWGFVRAEKRADYSFEFGECCGEAAVYYKISGLMKNRSC